LLSPLVRAAESGTDLVPEIELITRYFGFDSFTYRIATSLYPDQENRIFEFTTLPAIWAIRYDQNAYVEVDPRVIGTWDRTVPMLWDQSIDRANNSKVDAFLDDALSEGIASGVCVPLYDEVGVKALVDFSSIVPMLETRREDEIHHALGDILIFARYFRELFKRAAIERKIPARNVGMPLSSRERECLALAARGVAIDAIGRRLGIDVRLVQTHFDSIRSKLGVSNSREAIARAIKDGLVAR
jgi:LuxR family transcriptional activator of conjugal transfer of Ti plasmids